MRARNLKPSFFSNEKLARLGPYAQLLFAGLWGLADREGRLENRPDWIKAHVFPYYDVPLPPDSQALPGDSLPLLLSSLAQSGFVRFYGGKGARRYIQILAFRKHQHPHVREPESVIPAPPTRKAPGSAPDKHRTQHRASTMPGPADSGLLNPDSLSLDSGIPLTPNAGPDRGRVRENGITEGPTGAPLREMPEKLSPSQIERKRQEFQEIARKAGR